jgi:hypothetical protein
MIGSAGTPQANPRSIMSDLRSSLSILFLIIGFSVAAFFVDFGYLRKKLKVIVVRNSLISRVLGNASSNGTPSLENQLHISGEVDIKDKKFFPDKLKEEYRRQLF